MTSSGTLPVALVTGGSSGIGRACALALSETHEVWLTYNRGRAAAEGIVATIAERGGRAHALPLDTSVPASVDALRETFVREMAETHREARIDALVANAAAFGRYCLLLDLEEEEWDSIFATNTFGVTRLVRAFLEMLLPGGVIVHLSTISAAVGAISYKSYAHYTTSKAVTSGFLDGLAAQHAANGLRCVNVVSGLIETEMMYDFFGADLPAYAAEIPMQRFGTPEEMARLVVRLVSRPSLAISRIAPDGGWLQKGWRRIS